MARQQKDLSYDWTACKRIHSQSESLLYDSNRDVEFVNVTWGASIIVLVIVLTFSSDFGTTYLIVNNIIMVSCFSPFMFMLRYHRDMFVSL